MNDRASPFFRKEEGWAASFPSKVAVPLISAIPRVTAGYSPLRVLLLNLSVLAAGVLLITKLALHRP
jgi:hypothetical protein